MSHPRIYLDNNSTTPIAPEVKEAIEAYLKEGQANPSSVHHFGQMARGRLNHARAQIAKILHVKSDEICFTSGATEGLHMVIRGKLDLMPGGHVVTSGIEHAAVFNLLAQYEKIGKSLTLVPVGKEGSVDPKEIEKAIREDTKLIVVMAVNNETGVINPIDEIAFIAKKHHIPLIVDGVALLGKGEVKIPSGVSAMCFSGHKLHAPAGVGFVVLRPPFKVPPMLVGGPQELGRRAGTENMIGIVGMAKAIEMLQEILPEVIEKMKGLRDRFESELQKKLQGVIVNGTGERICNTSNIAFEGVDGESLLMNLDQEGIAVSHGSACSSGALEPSRILLNMGLPLALARASLRFSFSRYNTIEEIDRTVDVLCRIIPKLRKR